MNHKQQHIHDSYCSKDFHPDINAMIIELIVEGYSYVDAVEIIKEYLIENGISIFDVDIIIFDTCKLKNCICRC